MTAPPYAATGPWNNGGPPGISSAFLDNVENWIAAAISWMNGIDAPSATVVNGQTSGTATLYQPLSGTIKVAILSTNNYQNTGVQALNLPTPFTLQFWFKTTQINQVSFYNGGSIINCQVENSISATGGSALNETLIKGQVQGQCVSACTQIQTGIGGPNTGLVIMVGI